MVAISNTPTIVNFRARQNESTIETPIKSFSILNKVENFTQQTEKEVIQSYKNKLSKILPTATIMGLSLTLGIAEPTFAQEMTNDPIVSGELVKFFIKAALWLDVVALGASITSTPIIGFVNVFNAPIAKEWTHNLLRGIGITLFLQMLLIGLIYLAHLLFGENPYYIDPWTILAPSIKPAILEVARQFKP